MNAWVRVGVALVLCLVLGGLFVHADVTGEQRSPYPDARELATQYEDYVGQKILVFGTVTATSDSGIEIISESDGQTVELRVTGTDRTVEPGGYVQVYGTLERDQTIAAERVAVVNSSRWAELYKYGSSAIGALAFVLLFARYWRVDTETWTLEARDG